MNRIALTTLLVLGVVGGPAWAQTEASVRSISVSGTVETKIAPDLVVWSITLTDTDADMRVAKARNDEKIEAVLGLRTALDVADGDLETGSVSIRREYERDEHGDRTVFKHFVVNRGVTIRQRDLTRFDEFLDALVSSAEMDVYYSFESSKMHEVRAETRLKALAIAQQKARDMAETVGARLGDVITISEDRPGYFEPMSNRMMAQNAAFVEGTATDLASDRFIPGAMTVKMTVFATFGLL